MAFLARLPRGTCETGRLRAVENGRPTNAHPRRTTLTSRERVIDELFPLFRRLGYSAVTTESICEATGVERAELERAFPGGKAEMAHVALAEFEHFVRTDIGGAGPASGAPKPRLLRMMEALGRLYDGGRAPCLLSVFASSDIDDRLARRLREVTETFIGAFERIARESGLGAGLSRRRATEAFSRIQGALVTSRLLDETSAFERTIGDLPDLLLVG